MVIERSGFLLTAVALAAGGFGGWVLHEQTASRPIAAIPPPPMPPLAPIVVVEHVPPPPPACDDNVGSAEACPAVGPSDEGLCSNVAAKRCGEFKLAFKPKVAQAAVACLRRLKGNELCDPVRVNLCGHTALMAACADPLPASGPSAAAVAQVSSPVTVSCEGIVKSCASEALGPTMSDCRQTLSGMNELGRASMTQCLASHCGDRGLLGCEGKKG